MVMVDEAWEGLVVVRGKRDLVLLGMENKKEKEEKEQKKPHGFYALTLF